MQIPFDSRKFTDGVVVSLTDFIIHTRYHDLPAAVREQLRKSVLDAFAAMLGGWAVPATQIMANYAAATMPGKEATVVGKGKVCNATGAALANACAANALDIDDGFRPAKGHPGAVIIPAALAQAQAVNASGSEFLAAVVVGYEIGMRASVIWHGHPHRGPSYHGSGSWGSVGAAAACVRLLRLDAPQTLQALGIAEYHAPLAPIMTCVEHPAMVKDGIHWGAFVGVTSAQLAAQGFTGIPTVLAERDETMQTLGCEWWMGRVYYKFFPCCRWAQPAIAGALALRRQHDLTPDRISSVRVETFEAATHLSTRRPTTTEEAQYSLPFPVACALARGKCGVAEVTGDGLRDPQILNLSERIEMTVDPNIEARFPVEALASMTIRTTDNQTYSVGPLPAPGDADEGVTFDDLVRKCRDLVVPVRGERSVAPLMDCVLHCAEMPSVELLALLLEGNH
jgi:2-methylcitrate dehydratase PrpD